MVGYWLISIAYLFPLLGFPLWWVTFRAKSLAQVQFRLTPSPLLRPRRIISRP
jgi:hypothetical protein